MRDLFQEVWESVRRNKLRTALTGFAVAWGLFMLIVLLGIGNGLRHSTEANMGGISANVMEVWGGRTSVAYDGLKEGRRIRTDESDVKTTEGPDFADVIDEVSPTISQSGIRVSYGKRSLSTTLQGVYPVYSHMNKTQILAGRFLNDKDLAEKRKVVVVSSRDAENLLDGSTDYAQLVGKRVRTDTGISLLVIGIWKVDRASMGASFYVPYTTLRAIYAKGRYVDEIDFTFHGLTSEEENEAFENRYRAILNTRHRADPTDVTAIRVFNRFRQSLMMDKGMNLLNIGLWIVGLFTLLSGIVGVSNIMLITVKERTHEFGIRKAIGASPGSLIKLIIAEAVAITGFFGYLGMITGMALCEVVNLLLGSNTTEVMGETVKGIVDPTVGVDVALEATLLLIVAGTVAGLIPAWKAARVRPIEALRAD